MPNTLKRTFLGHNPDTVTVIRKEYNLEGSGRIEDALRIIREWVEKQPHFKKKDFSDNYLEKVLYSCKGSIEKTKKQIDRMCTVRTILPHLFEVRNPKIDYMYIFEMLTPALLPKLTPDHNRVAMVKINKKAYLLKDYLDYFIYDIMICDYLKINSYFRGYMFIIDFTETNIMDIISNLNPVYIRQLFSVLIEAYGMRLKGIYIYTPSKLVDAFVKLLKQVVKPKIASRIYTYKTFESLPNIVPLDILPKDYGGMEKPLKMLCDELLEAISSEEHLNYLRELKHAGTDESLRQSDEFNEVYAGMPGTFRVLSLD